MGPRASARPYQPYTNGIRSLLPVRGELGMPIKSAMDAQACPFSWTVVSGRMPQCFTRSAKKRVGQREWRVSQVPGRQSFR